MIQRLMTILREASARGDSTDGLAKALAVGAYVAFSPFIGMHTLMLVAISWIFQLNFMAMLIISNLINNPWTLVPVYAVGYACGQWVISYLCGNAVLLYNPSWMSYINNTLNSILGVGNISFWAFMLGGNIIGIMAACMVYPLAKMCIVRGMNVHKSTNCSTLRD